MLKSNKKYNEKRFHFKRKVEVLFNYLIDEFKYKLKYVEHKQPNGFVFSDAFIFKNKTANRLIKISNNYHPNDYGFELEIMDLTFDNNNINILKKKTIYTILKKKQTIDQKYLNRISEDLRERHKDVIVGKAFFDDAMEYSNTKPKKNNTIKIILLWIIGVILIFLVEKLFNTF